MKYIDADKLITEIEQLKETNKVSTMKVSEYVQGGIYGFDLAIEKIVTIITSHPQEQPDVDLAKFTEKIDSFKERYKNNPERVSIKGAMAFMARMFYQYPAVAREWYENLPKATMD